MALFDLSGHVALVTGGNHGIGAATARILAECGARVLIAYLRLRDEDDPGISETYRRNRASDAEQVLAAIRERGGEATAIEADLADPESPRLLFDTAESELGPVDILVNNASGWLSDSFVPERRDSHGRASLRPSRVSADSFGQQFAVDARGTAMMIAEFAGRHTERGAAWGRIIGLTSGGPGGFPGEASYGAAKAALENYTMTAAFELAHFGVTANVVYPPVTDTGWITDEVRRGVEERPDMFHIVEPDEVARVISYLASDDARLITGNILHLR